MEYHECLSHFEKVKKIRAARGCKETHQALCPCHNDKVPSLTISESNDGKILFHCQAGCDTSDILASVGLSYKDLAQEGGRLSCFDKLERFYAKQYRWEDKDHKSHNGYGDGVKIVAEYPYLDENGEYLYSKLRFEGGQIEGKLIRHYFVNHAADEAKLISTKDIKRTLYGLPQFLRNKTKVKYVCICEGEKDCETLMRLGNGFGCVVTPGSASDWRPEFAHYFKGLDVIIFRDNDEPGRKAAERIQRDLRRYAFFSKIVNPSSLEHGDVTDYLKKEGGTVESLRALCDSVTSGRFANWVNIDKDGTAAGINAGLLAEVIAESEKYVILRNPQDDKDTFLLYEGGVYAPRNKGGIKAMIRGYLPQEKVSDNLLNNVYNLLHATEENIRGIGEGNSDPGYLNFKNGLFDIRERKLIPHSPSIFTTFQFSFDFDESKKECRTFTKYIEDLCRKPDSSVDIERMAIIQEYMGFILSNEPMAKIKAALVLYSRQGNSGKSVLIRLISAMLGLDHVASIKLKELTVENRFILGSLPNCRLIACGDESNSSITDSSIFKALTGGDPVKIEPKGRQGYSFIFKGGFMIACNGLPAFLDDKGNHLFARLMIVPCEHHIAEDEKDPALDEKLYKERQAILNWALDGFYRLKESNFTFTKSESCLLSKEEYRRSMDNVYRFVKEGYIITGRYEDRISKTDFDKDYLRWANSDHSIQAVNPKNLSARMEAIGIVTDRGNIGERHNIAVYRCIAKKLEGFQEVTQYEQKRLPF